MNLNMHPGSGNWSNQPWLASSVLVSEYKKKEELWNTKSELYKHTQSRQRALEDIARTLQTHIPNISSEDVKRQIMNLRSRYITEKKKMWKKELNNEVVYKSNLWCFYELSFLDEHIKNYSEETFMQKDICALFNSAAREDVNVEVNPFNSSFNGDEELFGKYVAMEMKNLTKDNILREFKEKVLNAIMEAKMQEIAME